MKNVMIIIHVPVTDALTTYLIVNMISTATLVMMVFTVMVVMPVGKEPALSTQVILAQQEQYVMKITIGVKQTL